MKLADFARLLLLAAIWGSSFLFMRIAAPTVGAVPVAASRVLLAALFLGALALLLRRALPLREHWPHFLVVGALNSAVPFVLFGQASKTLSASLMGVINATAPIWAALIGALWRRTPLGARNAAGLALGVVGVALLVGLDSATLRPGAGLAVAAALAATFCYGLASTYAKHARSVEAFANAHGSMWGATALLLPLWIAQAGPPSGELRVLGALAMLGIVCSGVAYLLFFRLIADVGPASALTVTFLVPAFGILWGHLFLDEPVGWHTAAGGALVLAGTALATGAWPRARPG